MPAPEPDQNEPEGPDVAGQPMTREQWLAYQVARAPKITRQQWADTLFLLHNRKPDDNETDDEQKAS